MHHGTAFQLEYQFDRIQISNPEHCPLNGTTSLRLNNQPKMRAGVR